MKFVGLLLAIIGCYWLYMTFGTDYVVQKIYDNTNPQMVLGQQESSRTIILFFDYDQSDTVELFKTIDSLLRFEPSVRVVLRPVAGESEMSKIKTRVALAARDTQDFQKVHSILIGEDRDLTDEAKLEDALRSEGMNYDKIKDSVLLGKTEDDLEQYKRDAQLMGVLSLPGAYFGGKKVTADNMTVDYLVKIVNYKD